jgi:uncharacterized repeat protein (TIGR01451 family)
MKPQRLHDRSFANIFRLGRRRSPRGALALLAGAAVATVGAAALVSPLRANAITATPVAAEGDSYALGGYVTVLGGDPVNIGPVAPSIATAPKPLNPDGLNVATFSCNGTGCVPGVINSVDVTADTSKAFVPGVAGAGASVAATDCNPYATVLPTGFVTGPLTGGNACSNIAHVEIGGATGIVADGVSVQSLTQSCTAAPVPNASIVDLFVGGTEIAIPPAGTITPNDTIAIPMVATVILNEQIAENKSAPGPGGTTQSGHGMIVNAVHVIVPTTSILAGLAGADIIIGHAHSDAICATPVTPLCTTGSTDPTCAGVVITKLPEGLTVIGNQFFGTPGQTFSYSISIANVANCPVTLVRDTLPVHFTFVSAKGALGTPLSVNTAQNGGQVITWFKGSGWSSPNPLVETITVKIAADTPPGAYINLVETLSDCGNNTGTSPPVNVGNPPAATPTPTASATSAATALPTSAVSGLITPPNTGARPSAIPAGPSRGEGAGLLAAGLATMAAAAVGLGRRRRSGETH